MASGHVNRIKRPDTWLHRPILQNVKKALANPEPSTHDPECPKLNLEASQLMKMNKSVAHPSYQQRPTSAADARKFGTCHVREMQGTRPALSRFIPISYRPANN